LQTRPNPHEKTQYRPGISPRLHSRGTHPGHGVEATAATRDLEEVTTATQGLFRRRPPSSSANFSHVSSSFPSFSSPLPNLCPRVWISCQDVPAGTCRMAFGRADMNIDEVEEKRLGGVVGTAAARTYISLVRKSSTTAARDSQSCQFVNQAPERQSCRVPCPPSARSVSQAMQTVALCKSGRIQIQSCHGRASLAPGRQCPHDAASIYGAPTDCPVPARRGEMIRCRHCHWLLPFLLLPKSLTRRPHMLPLTAPQPSLYSPVLMLLDAS
jgi:hypothetical protein